LSCIACLLDRIGDKIESLLCRLDIWCDTTLITDVACRLAILLLGESLELLVYLGDLAKGFAVGWGVTVEESDIE
jgi:hypothetical protein